MLILYKIVTFLAYYLTLPYTFGLALMGSFKWKKRLGLGLPDVKSDTPPVWLHAASMGEVSVLAVLTNHIRRQNAGMHMYITVMTETGYNRARSLLPQDIHVSYMPLDYRSSVKRFLEKVKPSAAVFIETEIWPNFILELHGRDIPIVLANGRLSEKSARRYALFGASMKKVMSCYSRIIVQSEENKARFMSIGAEVSKICVSGSLKFDVPVRDISDQEKAARKRRLPFEPNSRIWICGSSRSGEHDQLLDMFVNLKRRHPLLKMVLVPRHLEKIADIMRMITERRLAYARYSDLKSAPDNCDVLLVDQIGCLNDLYPVSDIAFVGGTLVNIGGHNLLEPVWAGVPVLFGPHIANVKDSAEYIEKRNYGLKVDDKGQLEAKLDLFLSGRLEFARKADDINGTSGASKTAQVILSLLQK